MNEDKLSSRIEALQVRHRELDNKIEDLGLRGCPFALQDLKRQKLRLKDQIRTHRGQLRPTA